MAEQVQQPTFPDLSGGIDYTKYTVEGRSGPFYVRV